MSVSSPDFSKTGILFHHSHRIAATYEQFETLEGCMDLLGYIPYVGTISAVLFRSPFAIAQVIAGIAIGFFCSISCSQAHFDSSVTLTLIVNGLANGLRSMIEVVPFLSLITLLPMDLFIGQVISYPNDIEMRGFANRVERY